MATKFVVVGKVGLKMKIKFYDTNILFYHNNYGYVASYPTIEDIPMKDVEFVRSTS